MMPSRMTMTSLLLRAWYWSMSNSICSPSLLVSFPISLRSSSERLEEARSLLNNYQVAEVTWRRARLLPPPWSSSSCSRPGPGPGRGGSHPARSYPVSQLYRASLKHQLVTDLDVVEITRDSIYRGETCEVIHNLLINCISEHGLDNLSEYDDHLPP